MTSRSFVRRPEVDEGVETGIDVAGAAQAESCRSRAVLACMMDQGDRQLMYALKRSEATQEMGDLAAVVLIRTMEPDQRVEKK